MDGNKHALWQAFVVALVIFIVGVVLGTMFEQSRVDRLEEFYFSAETDVLDVELQSDLIDIFDIDCVVAKNENVIFADKIYGEAILLEKYDDSNKITDSVIKIHKRYDLLRILLWRNVMKVREKCDGVNVVLYFYDYVDPGVQVEAKQLAYENVLSKLKEKHGNDVILIPVAHDTGVRSVEILKVKYDLLEYPVIIINDGKVVQDLVSVEDLEKVIFQTSN